MSDEFFSHIQPYILEKMRKRCLVGILVKVLEIKFLFLDHLEPVINAQAKHWNPFELYCVSKEGKRVETSGEFVLFIKKGYTHA